MSHTEGPWRVVLGSKVYILADKYLIAEVGAQYMSETVDETIANARLIAAAPDLLAALTNLLEGSR